MRRARWLVAVVTASSAVLVVAALAGAAPEHRIGQDDLAAVRQATLQYRDPAAAEADGYELLDVCFEDEANDAGMGYHLLKGVNDTVLDPLAPEALVYEPTSDGGLGRLVGVEYIVPLSLSATAPEVMGVPLHANEALGLWVLHAWVWRGNPDGVIADYNPTVALCPDVAS
jgi:hypothetical protein